MAIKDYANLDTVRAIINEVVVRFSAIGHKHTKSEITDFPTIPSKVSELTNDLGYITKDTNTTYSISKTEKTVTLIGSDGNTSSFIDEDTTYSAGEGISLSGTEFSNAGVRHVTTGDVDGSISVNTGGVTEPVLVKGLGSAAFTESDAYDESGAANIALEAAKAYTDGQIDAIVGEGAAETLNTIGEISEALKGNAEIIDTLATKSSFDSHVSDGVKHITEIERTDWNLAKTHSVQSINGLSVSGRDITYTKNDGSTGTITTQDTTYTSLKNPYGLTINKTGLEGGASSFIYDGSVARTIDIDMRHTHNYAGSASPSGAAISLANFTNTNNVGTAVDSFITNGIGYVTGTSGILGQSDGAIFAQRYNNNWITQIYQDYRTGQIALRGKNNGTWEDWRIVLDTKNFSVVAATKDHVHGNWRISGDRIFHKTSSSMGSGGRTLILINEDGKSFIHAQNANSVSMFDVGQTGDVTCNGYIQAARAVLNSKGGSWINGKTLANASIAINTKQTTSNYHPILAVTSSSNNVWNIGGLGDNVGMYGFYAARTANGTDWSTVWNTSNGTLAHSGDIIVNNELKADSVWGVTQVSGNEIFADTSLSVGGTVKIENGNIYLNNGQTIYWGYSTGAKIYSYGRQNLHIAASDEVNAEMFLGVTESMWTICFTSDTAGSLGTPKLRYKALYAYNGTIQTSDRTEKKDINYFSEDSPYINLILNMKPCSYKMIKGESGRTHTGMIAQDIEEIMADIGLTDMDFAGFIRSPKYIHEKIETVNEETGETSYVDKETIAEGEYTYSLRYDEFISPMIATIQKQQREIDEMRQMIKELRSIA